MNKELLMLILGVFFLLFGLFFSRAYAWKQLFPYIPIAVGLVLIYITTIGPLSNKAIKSRVLEVKSIKGSEVKSIHFKPSKVSSTPDTTFAEDYTIVERKTIENLCLMLNKAKLKERLGNKMNFIDLKCRVEIEFYKKPTLCFGLIKKRQTTIINISSNCETGWHFADLTAPEFGLAFDEIFQ